MGLIITLACPSCGVALEEIDSVIACPHCNQKWLVRSNVPRFTVDSPYWGEIDQPTMQKVNRLARETSWKEAIHQVAPQLTSYVEGSHRTDWTKLIPIKPTWKALDVGAGLGGITFPLSEQVSLVVAIESVSERAEFIELRRQQEYVNNVQVVAASIHDMPMPTFKFNLVVMNGVLEWVALSEEGDPNAVQREVLKRFHSMLDTDGWIYIGIENRYSIDFLMGGRDHSGLRFTSLLPRRMADFIMRINHNSHYRTYRSMDSYRTYTYSYWGYRQLLEASGYTDIKVWGTDSYNQPNVFYDLDHPREFRRYLQGFSPNSMRDRVLRSLGLAGSVSPAIKLLTPNFCIIAKKG